MALKHRKLFSPQPTNQSLNCSGFCDPFCPSNCNQYDDSPPPTPPQSMTKSHHISPVVIIVVTVLASLFLLITNYIVVLKYCRSLNRSRARQARSNGPDEDQFLDENHGPEMIHPIWYISTIGLQPSVINSITVFKYKTGESLVEGTDCSVCLNEFQDDETLRLLPKCNHAFHIPCIDTWLRSHTNCPFCRAGILSNPVSPPFLAQNSENPLSLSPIDDTQVANIGSENELDSHHITVADFSENRVGTEEEVEVSLVSDEAKDIQNPKTEVHTTGNNEYWVMGDSRNKNTYINPAKTPQKSSTCVLDTLFLGDNNVLSGDETQAMRRSVSLDSRTAANIGFAVTGTCRNEGVGSSVDPRENVQNLDITKRVAPNSRIFRMMGGSSFAESLHKGPVSMKRSFSCSGRQFLSRNYGISNSILP